MPTAIRDVQVARLRAADAAEELKAEPHANGPPQRLRQRLAGRDAEPHRREGARPSATWRTRRAQKVGTPKITLALPPRTRRARRRSSLRSMSSSVRFRRRNERCTGGMRPAAIVRAGRRDEPGGCARPAPRQARCPHAPTRAGGHRTSRRRRARLRRGRPSREGTRHAGRRAGAQPRVESSVQPPCGQGTSSPRRAASATARCRRSISAVHGAQHRGGPAGIHPGMPG